MKNLAEINTHNSKPNISYFMGLNQFTHLTKQEFQNMFVKERVSDFDIIFPTSEVEVLIETPNDVDW